MIRLKGFTMLNSTLKKTAGELHLKLYCDYAGEV